MLKKSIHILLFSLIFLLVLPQLSAPSPSLMTVFRLTEQPNIIVRGAQGSALTIDISFGDHEIEQLLDGLEQPYPLLFVDPEWAKRFPMITETIKKRRLPVALLGQDGTLYEENPQLFQQQLKQFEEIFEMKPLWFRTRDEVFPSGLLQQLSEHEVNALGSTVVWRQGPIPPATEGEIISIPHHREERAALKDIQRISKSRDFQSVEDLLFQTKMKYKKMP